MGEFLHKSRQGLSNHSNTFQSHPTQRKASEKNVEAEQGELTNASASVFVVQRKWECTGEDEDASNNQCIRPVSLMEDFEEEPVQRKGPVPIQFYEAEEEEPIQRRGPVPLMTMEPEEEEPIQRRGPIPLDYYAPDTEEPVQRRGLVPLQFQFSEEEEEPVQKKGPVPLLTIDSDVHSEQAPSSSGRMPSLVQRKMESFFGEDFSDVNIHSDSYQSKELNAHAFTKGNAIHFAPGMYNPESQEGRELLGHELTHVVQQKEGRVQPTVQKKGVNINDDEGLEKEADEKGEKAAKEVSFEGSSGNPDQSSNVEEQNESEPEMLVGIRDNLPVGDKEAIIQIQSYLKALGYYHGAEDGIITRRDGKESDTIKGIRSFQREHQLVETGYVDHSTNALLKSLGAVAPREVTKDDGLGSTEVADSKSLEAFFLSYENFARAELNHWYSNDNSVPPEKCIDASCFSREARRIYNEKGDLRYVVPVQYALAQLKLEGGLKGVQRSSSNVFNVYAYDSGVTAAEKKIDTLEKGFSAYYSLMADRFLSDKDADGLLENGKFTNKDGDVYATNPFYEVEIKSEIGSMYYRASDYVLSGSVGVKGKNRPEDVKIVGALLNKAGYLPLENIEDVQAVSLAIMAFQKKEMIPADESWFKEREKQVINEKDKASIETKKEKFADGCINTNGQTIGLLYYQTVLNNKIPDVTIERDKRKLEKSDRKGPAKKATEKKGPVSKEEIKEATKSTIKAGEKNAAMVSPDKSDPKELYEKYSKEEIDIVKLGQSLVPYCSDNAKMVLEIFEKISYWHRDNLAFVITKTSDDSTLSGFNKDLLRKMSDYLSGYFNTYSWGDNSEQAERIFKVLKQEEKAKQKDVGNKNPVTESKNIDPIKAQKELYGYFVGGKHNSKLPKVFGGRSKFDSYLKDTKLSASVGKGGVNKEKDVELVVDALKAHQINCTKESDSLIEAIITFQTGKMAKPDGNITPGGKTAQALGLASGNFTIGSLTRKKKSDGTYVYGKGTETEDYYKKVDLIEKNMGVVRGSKEEQLLHAAREASVNSKFFDEFTKDVKAELIWRNATKSLEGVSLNSVLENRITKFHKFCVAAGLYYGNMAVTSAVRSPISAHRYCTEHYINYRADFEGQIKKNLVEMYNDSKYRKGDMVVDLDGNEWAKKEYYKFEEGKDKAKAVDYSSVKNFVKQNLSRSDSSSVAAEGYDSGRLERIPLPLSGKPGKSLHITGNAIDVNSKNFTYRDEGITDLLALNFGLVRCAPGEQWHFECTDLRVSSSEQEVIEQEKR